MTKKKTKIQLESEIKKLKKEIRQLKQYARAREVMHKSALADSLADRVYHGDGGRI